jgi:hypothetical protein
MAHKVRTHHWYNGILEFRDHLFDTLEQAVGFANDTDSHVTKVYDENNALVHQVQSIVDTNTYA